MFEVVEGLVRRSGLGYSHPSHCPGPGQGTRLLKNSHSEPSRFLHWSFSEDNADQILIR